MSSENFDLCGCCLTEHFSSDLGSLHCPIVGICGHSICRTCIQGWHKSLRANTRYLTCPMNCSDKVKDRKTGETVELKLLAFRADNPIPNFSLCKALGTIHSIEAKRSKGQKVLPAIKNITKDLCAFDKCTICKEPFSSDSKSTKAPMVGACGNTFCARCLKDYYAQEKKAKRRNIKYFHCPKCKEDQCFKVDSLADNHRFRDALCQWSKLQQQEEEDIKEEKVDEVVQQVRHTRKKRKIKVNTGKSSNKQGAGQVRRCSRRLKGFRV